MTSIGFIGAGNMGGSIISGILRCDKYRSEDIYVCDKVISDDIARLSVNICDIKGVIKNSDYIVLAVKPNTFDTVLKDIKSIGNYANKAFISVAAGITIDSIKQILGNDTKVVRVMPNLPLKVGEGMTVVSHCDMVSKNELDIAVDIFDCVGRTVLVEESYIDKCIAINGSSPAYVFMFIEAMADAAVKNGIDRKTAYLLSAQSVLGSAKMVLDTNLHPAVLKDMVCSPGGTTIDAVCSLEENGFRSAVMDAVEVCTEKAIKMSGK